MAAVEAPLPAAGGPLGPAFGADLPAEVEALDWAAMGLCLSEFPDFGAAPPGCPAAAEHADGADGADGADVADGAFGSFLSSLLDGSDDCSSEGLAELQCKPAGEKAPRAGSPSSGESTVTKDEARKIRNRESAATSRERQKARAAAERVRLEVLERENSALRHQLENVIQENGELRSMLASYTSSASKGKENQGPVESAELIFGNLLPLGSQPEPFPLRAAPFHSGRPTSCPRPWQSRTSQSPAGPAKGPGRERARTASPPPTVIRIVHTRFKVSYHQVVTACRRPPPPPPQASGRLRKQGRPAAPAPRQVLAQPASAGPRSKPRTPNPRGAFQR